MATDKKISYEMQGNVRNYLGKQKMVRAPLHWQSGPGHPKTQLAYITKPELDLILKKDFHGSLKKGPNVGPSGIMSLNDPGTGRSGSEMSAAETGGSGHGMSDKEARGIRLGAVAAGAQGTKDEMRAAKEEFGRSYRGRDRRSNIFGNVLRGIGSFFGGIPGKAISLLSRINPARLRGINPVTGQPNTQEEYEEQKRARINQKSIDTILGRKAPITDRTISNLGKLGYTGDMPAIGSTADSRAYQAASDKDYATGLNTFEGPYSRTHIQSLADNMDTNNLGVNNQNVPSNEDLLNTPTLSAEGGRIGYERGRVVNPGGYAGDTWRDFLASQAEWQIRPNDDWRTVYHRWLDSQKADGGIARLL